MDNGDAEEDLCPICKEGFEEAQPNDYAKLSVKGADKINLSSQQRGRDDVIARQDQRVHTKCRLNWTNSKAIKQSLKRCAQSSSPVKKKSQRVSLGPYDRKKDCLFCGREIIKGTHS